MYLKSKVATVKELRCDLYFVFLILFSELKEGEPIDASSTNLKEDGSAPHLTLVRKKFSGRYAITSEEFTNDMVSFKVNFSLGDDFFFSFLFRCSIKWDKRKGSISTY